MTDTIIELNRSAEDAVAMGVDVAEAEMRDAAVSKVDQTADALDTGADTRDAGSFQAAALGHLADTVTSTGAGLYDKPMDVLVDDAALFARRNSFVFLEGAVLVGFTAACVLKAPSPRRNESDDPSTVHSSEARLRPAVS